MLTGGLSRWRKAAFAPFGEPEGFPSTYAAGVFSDSRGDLWFGTWGKGLFRMHDGRLIPSSPPPMPISTPIRAITEDKIGRIWVGTWFDGIYRYDDGGRFKHYLLGTESPGNAVSALLADRHAGLWVGTYNGLFYFSKGEPSESDRSLFLEAKLITCILEDEDGSVLVGTNSGLFRIRQTAVTQIADLPHPHILSLARDKDGYVWIGTKAGGLAVLHQGHVTVIPEASGLPKAYVNTAIEDKDGHMWLGTSRGVVRVSLNDLHTLADGRQLRLPFVLFGRDDGMRSSECGSPSMPASTITRDGTLWFVTTKGFAHTTDVAEQVDQSPPKAELVGWTLSDDIKPEHVMTGAVVDLGAEQSELTFFFNATDLANPSRIEFRYRLVGYDADWTVTSARWARYRRISPGKYSFEVQARNSGEAWETVIASVPVKQQGHFYQTWYFYTAMLLLAIALGAQFFRQRVQLVKGQIGIVIEERNRIARECHDTLMAGFAAISWQLEATAKLFRDSNSGETAAAKSCELARSMVSHCQAEARRIIWDLRDSDEITTILSQALSRTLAAGHPSDSIAVSFRVEGDEVPLAPAYVHHLVCIGQEAVSNAVRHAST